MAKNQQFLPERRRRDTALAWLVAVVCAFLAVAVIVTGVVVFSIYLVYRPKTPYIKVSYAHLDSLVYDQTGLLDVQMIITVEAANDNTKAHATFTDADFNLSFARTPIATLRADVLEVPKNSSWRLQYVVKSTQAPLDDDGMAKMDAALKTGRVAFDLRGQARTRWRVGVFISVKFWTHLNCKLQFLYPGGDTQDLDCTSKSH